MCTTKHAGRGLVASVLTNSCPKCREGKLFTNPNPYDFRTTMRMPEHCPACGQAFELQTGFYFGTGYVSYGLSILFCALSFITWFFTIGVSANDNRLFWWLGINGVVLLALQPLLQRLSRSIWIACFVRYDEQSSKALKGCV